MLFKAFYMMVRIREMKFKSNRSGGRGGPPGGDCQDHLNPKLGGQRGEPEALSQPVDPGGVGGFKG